MLDRFASSSCSRLASADKSGQVVIWDLVYEDDTVDGSVSGTFTLSKTPGNLKHVAETLCCKCLLLLGARFTSNGKPAQVLRAEPRI